MSSAGEDRELLSLISHELRSPAAVVAGYLRLLLRDDIEVPERARQIVREAEKSSTRLLNLVKELSDLAGLSSGDAASQTTAPVFALCADAVQEAAEGRTNVGFVCAEGDLETLVRGDSGQLRRALTAFVQVTLRERGDRPLEISAFVNPRQPAAEAIVALGDPGIAVTPSAVLSRRDQQFERWRGGTGLSIPIACRIFEISGGQFWALPENSRAACAVSLPVWAANLQETVADAANAGNAAQNSEAALRS